MFLGITTCLFLYFVPLKGKREEGSSRPVIAKKNNPKSTPPLSINATTSGAALVVESKVDTKATKNRLDKITSHIEALLAKYRNDERFGSSVGLIRKEYDREKSEVTSALSEAEGLSIDFFLMIHESPFGESSEKEIQELTTCHTKILKGLEELAPQAVGMEGGYDEKESMPVYIATLGRLYNLSDPTERDKFDNKIKKQVQVYAPFQWQLRDLNRRVTGVEDPPLHENVFPIHKYACLNENGKSIQDIEDSLVVEWRSYVSLAKFIRYLKTYGLKHGAMVYGAAHGVDFAAITPSIGVKSRFYNMSGGRDKDYITPRPLH